MDNKDTILTSDEDNTITINIDDVLGDTYLDTSNMSAYQYTFSNTPLTGNITIGAAGSSGSFYTSTGLNGSSWLNANSNLTGAGLHVTSDAEIDGDLKVKGISILETLQKIESRLAILRPNPEKLEHFAALKKAYEHYKTLEALCEIPKEEDKE
jgi:hypothetical protein